MEDELSLREIFVLLPRLMILKDKKKIRDPISIYKILKVLGLPDTGEYYKMVRKWSLPKYLFIKKIKGTKHTYTIEDKTFWNYVRKRNFDGIMFFDYIQTKIVIIE